MEGDSFGTGQVLSPKEVARDWIESLFLLRKCHSLAILCPPTKITVSLKSQHFEIYIKLRLPSSGHRISEISHEEGSEEEIEFTTLDSRLS